MLGNYEAYDSRERDMEQDEDHVSVYEKYAGLWAWRVERNGCGKSSTQLYATRREATDAAHMLAKIIGLPYICK